MQAIFSIFQLPILVLNVFGFIGSAVWLLILGEWRLVLVGLLMSVTAPFFLGLASLPTVLLGGPGIFFAKRGITIGVYFFSFLASIYIAALISAWCGTVAFYFLKETAKPAFWPLLIWSYGVATSPWTYMAQQDGSLASMLAAFFAQAAFIVMMIGLAFGADLTSATQIFAAVMVLEVLFHMRLVADVQREGLY
ncbi:hypothetical protein [Bradyrhizobium sp. SZCCHNRI3043]|uniref:hypothetical protein n=1 Tax=Bradyrhizobium sp. SZCCHNRI3043 TaxID=3057292 RepID=UPI0028E96EE6|nr:hypothetical protein [Bradyrhizobium sp. SZCCHNRI3043]